MQSHNNEHYHKIEHINFQMSIGPFALNFFLTLSVGFEQNWFPCIVNTKLSNSNENKEFIFGKPEKKNQIIILNSRNKTLGNFFVKYDPLIEDFKGIFISGSMMRLLCRLCLNFNQISA
jgi:hypothetical protein